MISFLLIASSICGLVSAQEGRLLGSHLLEAKDKFTAMVVTSLDNATVPDFDI